MYRHRDCSKVENVEDGVWPEWVKKGVQGEDFVYSVEEMKETRSEKGSSLRNLL